MYSLFKYKPNTPDTLAHSATDELQDVTVRQYSASHIQLGAEQTWRPDTRPD